jgi:hypothetical protein
MDGARAEDRDQQHEAHQLAGDRAALAEVEAHALGRRIARRRPRDERDRRQEEYGAPPGRLAAANAATGMGLSLSTLAIS